MARKNIEHTHQGLRTPRERIWQAIRKLRDSFTTRDLMPEINPPVDATVIRTYLPSLVAAGYLTCERHVYTLIRDAFDAPRVSKEGAHSTQGMATLAMWRAMRALGQFDAADIARSASLGELQVPVKTASSYIQLLHKAGYFRIVQQGRAGAPTRYQLVRYTGAQPPAITRRKCVFDRNVGEFTWQQSEQEVCDDDA